MAQTKENERLSAHIVHRVLDDPICANDCSLYTITDDAGIQYNQAVANVADEDEINTLYSWLLQPAEAALVQWWTNT